MSKMKVISIVLLVALVFAGAVSVYAASRCNGCAGMGRIQCMICKGTGQLKNGNSYYTCSTCKGWGTVPCRQCGGDGIYGN